MTEKPGYVYFARAEDGLVKIGFTRDIVMRLVGLNSAGHGRVTLLGIVSGPMSLEGHYHRRYSRSRITGEWFKATPAILREAAKHFRKPEEVTAYSTWGRALGRVSIRIERTIIEAIREDVIEYGGRTFDGQVNFMLKECLRQGWHLARDKMVWGDLYGDKPRPVFTKTVSVPDAGVEAEKAA